MLKDLQKEQQAAVIVQDEHQNTIGLVTLEDIVEEKIKRKSYFGSRSFERNSENY